jgi:hypothetical protein
MNDGITMINAEIAENAEKTCLVIFSAISAISALRIE